MTHRPVTWLDRRIAAPGPYLCLCLNEATFRSALRHLKSPEIPQWCRKSATTHMLENEDGRLCCVVTMRGWEGRNPIEVAGLLVHEAVHVWQNYCRDIGEHEAGDEQEAYAIQSIAQELMADFERQTRRKR